MSHNQILLQAITEYIVVVPTPSSKRSIHNSPLLPSPFTSAQAVAALIACHSIFSSSIAPFFVSRTVDEEFLRSTIFMGDAKSFQPLFPDGEDMDNRDGVNFSSSVLSNSYQGTKSSRFFEQFAAYGYQFVQGSQHEKGLVNLINFKKFLLLFLLHCCPTVQKFAPAILLAGPTLNRDDPVSPRWPASNISSLPFDKFITSCFGNSLKTLIIDQPIKPPYYNDFTALFSNKSDYQQQTNRHPLPLLETIVFLNMDESMLIAMCDQNDGNFSPCPSLHNIHFIFNSEQEPINCGDCGAALACLIQSYAEFPHSATIRNNLKFIKFDASDIGCNDPFDMIAPQDAAAVILACAKYLPHCLRSLAVSTDSRFTSGTTPFRSAELISCFDDFQVLNSLEICCDHVVPEDNEPSEFWSDEENGTKLLLPRSLTSLKICQPVIDGKCIADAFQARKLPYLQTFRYQHHFEHNDLNNPNNDNADEENNDAAGKSLMVKVFQPIASTLRCLELSLCFREHCNAPFQNPSSSYLEFNKNFCDPQKQSCYYLLNTLEEFSLAVCDCCSSFGTMPTASSSFPTIEEVLEKEESPEFLQGEENFFFPLLNSKSLKKFLFRGRTDGTLLRRLLIGDDDNRLLTTATIDNESKNLPFEFLCLHQTSTNPQHMQKIAAELAEIAVKYPNLPFCKSLKRLTLFFDEYPIPYGKPQFSDLSDASEEMIDFLGVITLYPSIEIFEFCGAVKSIFLSPKVSEKIKTREDLEKILKEKGNLDTRLKYIDLGVVY